MQPDEIRRRWSLAKGTYVLYLGRIVPEKRVDLLLEAYRMLETDIRLVIAGAASDTVEYERRISQLAAEDNRVIMTGFVSGRTLEELYSNAFCYVLPSDVEGMPLSLLEAMSYGRCCVTSDIPECADVLADAGLTFERGNGEALRNTLAGLLANRNRVDSLGAKALERVSGNYDWDTVVMRTLDLYRDNDNVQGGR